MNEQEFYAAVGATDFSERYYALCNRYPMRSDPPCRCSKSDLTQMLSEIGRAGTRDSRDGSITYDRILLGRALHIGFAIQMRTAVDFWCWLEGLKQRVGGNYSVIAHGTATLAHMAPSGPPYPRPEFYNMNELRVILTECSDLSDKLVAILKQA